jgi:hypothetical protein
MGRNWPWAMATTGRGAHTGAIVYGRATEGVAGGFIVHRSFDSARMRAVGEMRQSILYIPAAEELPPP